MNFQRTILYGAAIILVGSLGIASHAQSKGAISKGISASGEPSPASVARGRYIADDLAVCSQCHTPHDPQGGLDRRNWLEGAPVWLQSAPPTADWPLLAPRIAGDPPGTDAEMIKLLTTGIWRDGKRLRPPMPQFRMSDEDAQSVLAYLKSLNPQPR